MRKFKEGLDRNQELLMPQKIEDYLDEEHLAKLIWAICSLLDLSKIESKYDVRGQHAYPPRMMVGILFYGYSIGIRSSRKLAAACRERLDFMYIAQGLKPSHDRISDFRKDNLCELKDIFQEIVLIGANLGLVKLGNVKASIDGTKIRANASAKLSKDEKGLKKLLEKTQKEIAVLLEEAEKIDEMEDEKYGKENRGDELPKELQSRQSREKAIKEAMEILIERKEQKGDEIREEKGRDPIATELKNIEKTKINVTDPDAKFMKERCGVIKPNYNSQISVDEEEQFIVANDATAECNDHHQLIPMIQKTKDNLGESPKQGKADNGYHSQLEDAVEMFPEIDFYVDDRNRRKEDINLEEIKEKYSEVAYENLTKLLSDEGEEEYKKRMHTAEPPFGNIKFNLNCPRFLLRGTEKVKGEFNLMCIGHNLKKIMRFITKKGMSIADAVKKIVLNRRNYAVNLG